MDFFEIGDKGETRETKQQQAAFDGTAGSLTSAYMVEKATSKC
jgi:hypothetical protein